MKIVALNKKKDYGINKINPVIFYMFITSI